MGVSGTLDRPPSACCFGPSIVGTPQLMEANATMASETTKVSARMAKKLVNAGSVFEFNDPTYKPTKRRLFAECAVNACSQEDVAFFS